MLIQSTFVRVCCPTATTLIEMKQLCGVAKASIVRVHQHAACVPRNRSQSMGRSRGGLTSRACSMRAGSWLPSSRRASRQNLADLRGPRNGATTGMAGTPLRPDWLAGAAGFEPLHRRSELARTLSSGREESNMRILLEGCRAASHRQRKSQAMTDTGRSGSKCRGSNPAAPTGQSVSNAY